MRDGSLRRLWRGGALIAAALALAGTAHAELFRCQGPDGRTIFTDQKGLCPEAENYEPKGQVQSAPTPARVSRPAARARGALDAEAEQAQAQIWQQKRRDAEQAVEAILKQREAMRPYVSHCNRGGYVTTRDDAGIKRRMSCNALRSDFDGLDAQEASARAYLDSGLAKDCRKAGCLPGWIR